MCHIGQLVLLGTLSMSGEQGLGAGQSAQAALEEGRRLYATKEYERAVGRLKEAVRLDPSNVEAYCFLGASFDALAGPRWTATLPPLVPLPPPPPPPPGARAWTPPATPAAVAPVASADPQTAELRRKAVDAYAHCLLLNPGDSDSLRRLRQLSFRARLEIGFTEEPPYPMSTSHAKGFARDQSLEPHDVILLARTFERVGRPDLAEESYKRLIEMRPADGPACQALAGLYLRPIWNGSQRFADAIATMERCAKTAPGDGAAEFRLAVFLWDKAFRDSRLDQRTQLAYADRGLAHVDSALKIQPDDFGALVYKGLLLRVKATATADRAELERLIQQARELQQRASGAPAPTGGALSTRSEPLRVGGAIKEPKKIKNVPPVYPDAAKQAGVQGVVILECTISPQGEVTDVKVLRGIPLLTPVAIDAVKQWAYTPTLFNGVPVPVIMTVTVNFRLSSPPSSENR